MRWRGDDFFRIFILIFIFCLFSKKFPENPASMHNPIGWQKQPFTKTSSKVHNSSPFQTWFLPLRPFSKGNGSGEWFYPRRAGRFQQNRNSPLSRTTPLRGAKHPWLWTVVLLWEIRRRGINNPQSVFAIFYCFLKKINVRNIAAPTLITELIYYKTEKNKCWSIYPLQHLSYIIYILIFLS